MKAYIKHVRVLAEQRNGAGFTQAPKSGAGFTLIELLMVIAIIGILATLAIISVQGAQKKAGDTKLKNSANAINKALAQYEIDNNKFYVSATNTTFDVSSAGNELDTALAQYIKSTVYSSGYAAKYTSSADGSSFAQAWELGNTSEAPVNSGVGVYATNAGNLAGAVDAGNGTGSSALSFDGTNDFASIPNNAAFNPAGNFTISFWVKPSGSLVNDAGLVEKWSGLGAYPFAFRINSATNSVKFLRFDGVATTVTATGTTNITSGGNDGWHHVVAIRNGATDSLVINSGTAVTAGDAMIPPTNATAIYLGSRGGASNFFKGQIDDLRIYNTNLTTGGGSQVEALYNSGRGTYGASGIANLVGLWRLDEGLGLVLADGEGTVDGALPTLPVNARPTWVAGNVPLGFTGIGSSLTGRAFVGFGVR